MVASKIDVANKDKLAKLKRYAKNKGLELFPDLRGDGKGIEELKYAMADKVEEIGRQATRDKLQENPSATETNRRDHPTKAEKHLATPHLEVVHYASGTYAPC